MSAPPVTPIRRRPVPSSSTSSAPDTSRKTDASSPTLCSTNATSPTGSHGGRSSYEKKNKALLSATLQEWEQRIADAEHKEKEQEAQAEAAAELEKMKKQLHERTGQVSELKAKLDAKDFELGNVKIRRDRIAKDLEEVKSQLVDWVAEIGGL